MKVPAQYSNLLFGCLLSSIQVTIISGAVVLINQGLTTELLHQWLKGFAIAWPVAFPSAVVVAPLVREIVARLTKTSS